MAVLAPMPSASARTATTVNAGILAQHADPVAKILQKFFQHSTGPHLSDFFFDLLQAAELDAGCAPRLRRCPYRPARLLVSQLVEITLQLVVEFPLDARTSEEIAPQAGQAAQ